MISTLAFVWNYWQFILLGIAVTAIIGYASFMLRNWKLAVIAAAILAGVVVWGNVWKDGYDKAWEAVVAEQKRILTERIKVLEDIEAGYKVQKASDDAELARLTKLVEDTPENKRAGIDAVTAKRIGAIR